MKNEILKECSLILDLLFKKTQKDSLGTAKEMSLLKAILKNPSLQRYREDKSIVDKSTLSVNNLRLYLTSPKKFIDSYYSSLKIYKSRKKHQKKMKKDEKKFYEEINLFFGATIILNPTQKMMEKSTILIPADSIGHDDVLLRGKK